MTKQKEDQFLQLMDEHAGIIHKIIRVYAQSQEDEQDLKQEIIFQAWKSFDRFKGDAKFSTWLYKVALNTALTHKGKDEKRKATEQKVEEPLTVPTENMRATLIGLIKNFSDLDKLIIMLHLDGYPNEEISLISGLKINHVAVKLHRLKEILTKKLKP